MHALALADVEAVLKRKPDHVKSVGKRIDLLLQLGRYSDALVAAQQQLSHTPGDADTTKARDRATSLVMVRAQVDDGKRKQNWAAALQSLEALIQAGANRDLVALERWYGTFVVCFEFRFRIRTDGFRSLFGSFFDLFGNLVKLCIPPVNTTTWWRRPWRSSSVTRLISRLCSCGRARFFSWEKLTLR